MFRRDALANYISENANLKKSLFSIDSSEYEVLSYSRLEVGYRLSRRYKASIKIMELHKFRDVIPVEIYLQEWHGVNGNADEEYTIDTWETLTDTTCLLVIDYKFRESVKLVPLADGEDYDFEKTIKLFGVKYKEVEEDKPRGI